MDGLDAKTMPFGKHKGERIDEIPSDYLRWLLDNANLDDEIAAHVAEVLRRRGDD